MKTLCVKQLPFLCMLALIGSITCQPCVADDKKPSSGDGISVVKDSDLQKARASFLALPEKERPVALLAAAGLINKKMGDWITARAYKTPVDRRTGAFILSKTMFQLSEMAFQLQMPGAMRCHAEEARTLERIAKGENIPEPRCRADAYVGTDKDLLAMSKKGRLTELLPTIDSWANTVIFYNIGVAHCSGYKI